MNVQKISIYQFLEGSGKSFVIPVYQRDCAWTKINCEKLGNDLIDLNNNSKKDRFLGTLVTIGSGFEEYTIIDGQQRLTIISLLLKVFHPYLIKKEEKNEEDKRIRLKPNKQDKEFFDNFFNDPEVVSLDSNIINNYNYFMNKINSEQLTFEQIFDSFKKIKIVLIDLERGQDNPQLIFESLNSTGVDLIRNDLLMDLEPINQEELYS